MRSLRRRPRAAAAPTALAPRAAVLADAARALASVTERGRSADEALAAFDAHPQRSAVRAVTLGSLRWYLRLLPALESLLQNQRRPLAAEVRGLFVATAHQIEYSRNAPEASVSAAVDAVRAVGHPHASALANAVLRRFVSERAAIFARIDSDAAVASAHPRWLVQALEAAWPEHVERVLAGNNAHPPFVLRLDLSRADRAGYLAELAAAQLPGHALEWLPSAVQLERPAAVSRLPGFAQGIVSVQDAGAQLAARLLDPKPGMRILDACAAPGGKTVHLLEHAGPAVDLTAVDIDPERLGQLEENLLRTGRRARVGVLDVRTLAVPGSPRPALIGDQPFERILVDAPCSGTGVIRRHPDIKLLRRPEDVPAFATTQGAILRGAFTALAPGGRLLYCTCSILPEENEAVVRDFLAQEPQAVAVRLPAAASLAPGGLDLHLGIQLLPGAQAGTDGFYYACIEKTTAGHCAS